MIIGKFRGDWKSYGCHLVKLEKIERMRFNGIDEALVAAQLF